ncbi:MAG: hypothetical protein Ct9H90mP25_0420 [Gammaproteobacteria bacterium]|nr:MAG: hypothetical protein Ct9H90mP25_0420 [Gammaproteobacteria bacterium]
MPVSVKVGLIGLRVLSFIAEFFLMKVIPTSRAPALKKVEVCSPVPAP